MKEIDIFSPKFRETVRMTWWSVDRVKSHNEILCMEQKNQMHTTVFINLAYWSQLLCNSENNGDFLSNIVQVEVSVRTCVTQISA